MGDNPWDSKEGHYDRPSSSAPGELARYGEAVDIVIGSGKASTSYLQRQMRIGYNEAARLIERMEAEGVLSAPDHLGRRELLGTAFSARVRLLDDPEDVTDDSMAQLVELEARLDSAIERADSDAADVVMKQASARVPSGSGPSYRRVVDDVLASGRASVTTLQRRMGLGPDVAAGFIAQMEADGIVSAPDAVGLREVLPAAALLRAALPERPAMATIMLADDAAADPLAGIMPEVAAASAREQAIARSVEGMLARVERQAGRFDGEAQSAIRQITERALMLLARRDAINADIRDLFSFAKDIGFNVRGLRGAIGDLREPEDERKQREAQREAYRGALGIEGPENVVEIVKPAAAVPAAAKRITAKEKNYQSTRALIAAGRIADAG